MKDLMLLFGGQSSEHSVSCSSAASLLPHVDRSLFRVSVVGITRGGAWFLTEATPEKIASGAWEKEPGNLPVLLSPNRAVRGLQILRNGRLESVPVDLVFPVMHGELCEDGAVQGLLEMCGIPYVGSDICASACSMDKTVTKRVAAASGIRQARYAVVTVRQIRSDPTASAQRVEEEIGTGYPFFVKPASAGSSVGVSKAHDSAELLLAFDKAAAVCGKILIEETIVGREVEVAVLGNDDPAASVVGEILAANDFYDYNAKYENAASRTAIPADIPEESAEALRRAALAIYRAMGCSGMARVDFFLLPDGGIVFNEINTLPGFTEISMYPKLWETCGIPYRELITRLCELALERGCKMR